MRDSYGAFGWSLLLALAFGCGAEAAAGSPATVEPIRNGSAVEHLDPPPSRPLSTAPEIREALIAAGQSPPALADLLNLDMGFDVDMDRLLGHFAYRACDSTELDEILGYLQEDSVPLFEMSPETDFSCSEDLSRCVSCTHDLSDCNAGTLFEFAMSPEGERYLAGVVARPLQQTDRTEVRTVDDFARVDVGHFSEVGVRCLMRERLASVEELWEVQVPASGGPVIIHLCGEEATRRGAQLAQGLGFGSWCAADKCVGDAGSDVMGLHWTGSMAEPEVEFVVIGPAECEGCSPEPPASIAARMQDESCP